MNSSRTLFTVSGFLILAFTHLFALTHVAGFHLDEAWAGNFAHRIAFEKGFWPFQAMSPYTTAWSHYITAFAFKVFRVDVFVFRATGIVETLAGIALICAALEKKRERDAAIFLPWVIAFFPTLVMNHRWVIEMNTFFVLCSGMITYGFASKRKVLLYLGAFLGITSHVLFLAPCLALLYWLWVNNELSRSERNTVSGFSLIFSLFFTHIYFNTESDDRMKALALILFSIALSAVTHIASPPKHLKKYFLWIPAILGIPLLVPFLLFSEGSWLALFSAGELQTKLLIGTFFIPVALLLFYYRGKFSDNLLWLPFCLILTLLMVVKPGPRYYEIPFLFCSVLFAIGLSRIGVWQARKVLVLWILFGSLQLGLNYFEPALGQTQADRTFRLWRFRDSSTDMLPIQRVALRLSREGCDYSDLKLSDERLDQCLKFLSYGDWPAPIPHRCGFGEHVDVFRTPGNEGQFQIGPVLRQPNARE